MFLLIPRVSKTERYEKQAKGELVLSVQYFSKYSWQHLNTFCSLHLNFYPTKLWYRLTIVLKLWPDYSH